MPNTLSTQLTFLTASDPVSMVRAAPRGGGQGWTFSGFAGVESMADDARDENDSGPRPAEGAALSARLRRLGEGLDRAGAERPSGRGQVDRTQASASAFARGFRLSSEFVAGVLAGAGLGWAIDHWLRTSPWGLILLTMLGFTASVVNLIRASGSSSRDLPDRRQG